MKIYLACGLTHVPRELFSQYANYIHSLANSISGIGPNYDVKYALVNSDPQLADKPFSERASLCYAWDRRMVEDADLLVADASFASTGLGIEMQIADTHGIPIILLIGDYEVNRADPIKYCNPDATQHELQIGEGIVSLMALGIPSVRRRIGYRNQEAAIAECVGAVRLFAHD